MKWSGLDDGRAVALAVLVVGASLMAGDARAQEAPATTSTLEDLAFMAGCWRGGFGADGVIEEYYMAPAGGLMLGMTRFLRGGRAVQHEFTRIVVDSAGVAMIPFPGGRRSEHDFRLTGVEGRRATFEAPEHDFPKRIIYRENADGSHTARIDGGPDDPQGQEWTMARVECR
jgi:hypothetical protein